MIRIRGGDFSTFRFGRHGEGRIADDLCSRRRMKRIQEGSWRGKRNQLGEPRHVSVDRTSSVFGSLFSTASLGLDPKPLFPPPAQRIENFASGLSFGGWDGTDETRIVGT